MAVKVGKARDQEVDEPSQIVTRKVICVRPIADASEESRSEGRIRKPAA